MQLLTIDTAQATLAPMATTGTKSSRFDAADDELVKRAVEVRAHAYSPYSKILVGAALRAADGRIFTGCNVENASFGMTWCAERTAIVKAVSEGAREYTAMAITTSLPHALMPCGACRQVLFEFAPNLRIIVAGADGTRYETFLEDLLPEAFGPSDLSQ
ncbi:MAG: cytidine deaminase [Planctomycetes bacterium]|nr:cytidine deaminase [Planctomycetota bacterium]